MSAFRSPVVLAAIALWIANDHLLKGLYPGLVTGKLSDACGLVVTPLLVLAIVGWTRPSLAQRPTVQTVVVVAVAIAFALTKTWPPANALYCRAFEVIRMPMRLGIGVVRGIVWSERISLVMDPTDLFVLPFALVPIRLARLAKVTPCRTEPC